MAGNEQFHVDVAPTYKTNFNTNATFIAQHSDQIYNGADIAWTIVAGALVALMIAGISLLHSGLSDRRSAITMFRLPLLTCAVVGCQWFLFGYSLAFSSRSVNDRWTFWGGTSELVFHNVLTQPVGNDPGPRIPEIAYAFFQEMFACFTACIVSGATYRKMGTAQFLIFIFIWTTLVYDPIARWGWHSQGWSRRNHSLDYAGGTVVHITSGAAAQAIAVWYGLKVRFLGAYSPAQRRAKRDDHLDEKRPHHPHNIIYVVLGTTLMWIGWFGFNGGSGLAANTRAASACMSTHIAACFGAVTALGWYALEKILGKKGTERESATVYFCDGALNGLVAITPAAGYVPPELAPVFGVVAASAIILAETLTEIVLESSFSSHWVDVIFMQYDVLHIGMVHAGSGIVGMCLTAFLNRPEVFALDGFSSAAGYSQDTEQLGHQLLDAALAWLYSFFITIALLWLSTFIKWVLSATGINTSLWDVETSLDVSENHAWFAGEVQLDKDGYELSLQHKVAPATGHSPTMYHNGGTPDSPDDPPRIGIPRRPQNRRTPSWRQADSSPGMSV